MSAGVVGARLESLSDTQGAMDATAGQASESGTRGVAMSEKMEAGLDEITQVLQNEFNGLATELRSLVQQTQARLDVAEWQGNRREQAVRIGAEFEADVRRVLDESESYVGEFRSRSINAALECVEGMRAGFGQAMEKANRSYQSLALEAATVRDQLSEIDSSSGLSA